MKKKILLLIIFVSLGILAREAQMIERFDQIEFEPQLNDHVYEKNPNRGPASVEVKQINGDPEAKQEIKPDEEKNVPQLGRDHW